MRISAKAFILLVVISISPTLQSSQKMYVPTGEGNELLIINLENNKVINRIDELENAHGLAAHVNSEYLVAGSQEVRKKGKNNSINKPAQISDAEHKAHHSGKEPVSPSYVSVIHPKHGHVMRRIAVIDRSHHLAFHPNGKYVVATHTNANSISIIDIENNQVYKIIKVGKIPNYAVFSQKRNRLYISNAGSGNISVIDTIKWAVISTIKVGKGPEHLALNSSSNRLYVLNVIGGTVSEIDLSKNTTISEFIVGKAPHGLALSNLGNNLYVSNKADNTLSNINLTTKSVRTMKLTPAPYHVAYAGETNNLYVSSRKEPKIWVIDPIEFKVKDVIQIGKGVAHQMVIK